MRELCEREVLLFNGRQWLALEGDYWIALLRLINAHGLNPKPYTPQVGKKQLVSDDDVVRLVSCLQDAGDDIPHEDLWKCGDGDPDPLNTPPHEFFSGAGVSYIESVLGFVGRSYFSIETTEPGTEYRYLGEQDNWPPREDARM